MCNLRQKVLTKENFDEYYPLCIKFTRRFRYKKKDGKYVTQNLEMARSVHDKTELYISIIQGNKIIGYYPPEKPVIKAYVFNN